MAYFLAFIIALVCTVVFTPVSILLARKFDVLDYPKARKVHKTPLPRWGGIGIFLGFSCAIAAMYYFVPSFKSLLAYHYKTTSLLKQFSGIAFAGTLVFVLGLIDDKKPIRALTKLLTMIIAAYITMDYGVRMYGLTLPFFGSYINFPIIVGQIVTVFWILGFMNTINLADGLDGLAAGIGAIAAGTFFAVALIQSGTGVIFLSKQLTLSAFLAAALAGACVGFLVWNFHPARVFMGDSGALFIGFMLAVISVVGTLKTTAMMSLLIPITVVALPVLDVALSMFRRFRKGAGIMEPDKDHLHHRLLRFGWSHREVVLLMYNMTLILSICSIILAILKNPPK